MRKRTTRVETLGLQLFERSILVLSTLYSQFSTVLKNCLAILSCASEPFSVGVSPMARMTCERKRVRVPRACGVWSVTS